MPLPIHTRMCHVPKCTGWHLSVPGRSGNAVDIHIITLIQCTSINKVPLDAVIEGLPEGGKLRRFGVLMASLKPQVGYPMPVLWISTESDEREWLL
ncbi:hypothetical protein [Parahaliea mediterranea]|uniref:hypothetical protein n=1 Tax=Parahaliea mediterranea TaxID=651086 RepID=UPI000E2F97DB|nr:hypothetical protein [Parahaliea mediterranea]